MKKNKKNGGRGLLSLLLILVVFVAGIVAVGFYMNGGIQHTSFVDGELEIHYIDICQGDCTLVKCGDHAMLIDAGENDKGTQIQDYLSSQNVKKLDYIIGTHPHSDHI